MELTVHVGWTSVRPVQPDQHWSGVIVASDNATDAELTAAQIVACRPECVMVTSTLIAL